MKAQCWCLIVTNVMQAITVITWWYVVGLRWWVACCASVDLIWCVAICVGAKEFIRYHTHAIQREMYWNALLLNLQQVILGGFVMIVAVYFYISPLSNAARDGILDQCETLGYVTAADPPVVDQEACNAAADEEQTRMTASAIKVCAVLYLINFVLGLVMFIKGNEYDEKESSIDGGWIKVK